LASKSVKVRVNVEVAATNLNIPVFDTYVTVIRAHYNEPEVRENRLQKCKEYNIKHKDSRPSRAEYQRNYRLKKKQELPPKPPKQIKAKKVSLKSKKIRYIHNPNEPDDLIIS